MPSSRRRLGVALLLDPPVADEVDGLRRAVGDPSLGRIAPHLTLVPPVNVRADQLPAALSRLRAAAASVPGPLRLTLGPVRSFLPHNPVLVLDVGGDLAQLRVLRDAVFAGPLERPLTWPWVPHVTVAETSPVERIDAALAALDRYAATADVDRVVLLEERSGRRWAPLADANLGPAVVIGTGGLALEISSGRMFDPEARQLLADAGADAGAWVEWEVPPAAPIPLSGVVMTARREGRVVGIGAATPRRLGVFVAPDVRAQGVGRHLTTHLVLAARRRGWDPAADRYSNSTAE
jgi:2'-5' RNA ligase